MVKKKQKEKLVDGELLAKLSQKLEDFRLKHDLSTGEFEFLLQVHLKMIEAHHKTIATVAEKEIKELMNTIHNQSKKFVT
jgi:Ser/Thr protein kinase RdoA (MazF antagonist)